MTICTKDNNMYKPTILFTNWLYYIQTNNNMLKPTIISMISTNRQWYVHADSIKYKQTIIQCIYKLTMQCISWQHYVQTNNIMYKPVMIWTNRQWDVQATIWTEQRTGQNVSIYNATCTERLLYRTIICTKRQ